VDSAIEVRNLTKHFGRVVAVDNLSFDVAAGRITGFLGPNGAGKSTLLRMAAGLSRPTSGMIKVLGGVPSAGDASLLERVGYLDQERPRPKWALCVGAPDCGPELRALLESRP
jgi:ABC-2 type transport system ATP-binding protein